MAYVTTIFPAREALDTLLRAHSWPSGAPTISWGAPTEQEDVKQDQIYQGAPDVEEVTFEGLHMRNDEEYQLRVFADVRKYGDQEKSAEERAWSHVNEILTLVKANPTLSGTVNRITGFNLAMTTLPSATNQWRSQVMVEIGVVGLVAP
jgi:hypothetical protein